MSLTVGSAQNVTHFSLKQGWFLKKKNKLQLLSHGLGRKMAMFKKNIMPWIINNDKFILSRSWMTFSLEIDRLSGNREG